MTLCALQPLAEAGAEAQTPTTYQGGVMGTLAGTEDKPQSKLWRHAGSWWGLIHSQVDDDVNIFKLAADHTWQDTSTVVDSAVSGRGDALAEGNTLYVVSRRDGGGGIRMLRYTYKPAMGKYKKDNGFPVLLSPAHAESATIAKDSTGTLWVTYTAPDGTGAPKVWVTHSTSADHKIWAQPFELPAPDTTVSADDISAVIALDGKIGVMWANQVSDAFHFVTHVDGAPADQWEPAETPLAGLDMADDHMNLKKAADGRLFVAVKTSKTVFSQPFVILLVRETDGTWSSHTHSTKADAMTRPVVLLDESNRRVFMFAAAPDSGPGTQVYYKTTSMDAPSFGPGRGELFVTWPGATINSPTSTKQAVDPAGGIALLASDSAAFRYYHTELSFTDTRPPDTMVDEGPADPSSSTHASFRFSADEPGTGFECKLDDAPDFIACSSGKEYEDLPAGDHTLLVRAVDQGGNRDQSPASHSWTIDTSPPETTIDEGPADPSSSTSASFSFSSDDPGAGFECKLDDATEFTACSSPKDYQDLAQGDHTLLVRAVDQAGNRDQSPAGHSWTVDTEAPETTIDEGPADPSSSTNASFSFSSDEPGASFECKLDDAADFSACSSPKDYQDLPAGDHTLLVRAVDQGGNTDQSPANHSWTIDTEAPETTIDDGPADPSSSTSASFSFSSDDPGAGFECKLDDATEFTACSSPKDYQDLAQGDHTLLVRAVDQAGNRDQSPAGHSWAIETGAPNTTIDEGPADPSSSTSASFRFSADEPGASFECKLDDAPDFTACSSPKDYQDLPAGGHTLEVRAVDAIGNADQSPASHSWTIDTSPPETTIDEGPADPSSSTSASFRFSADEPGASFECKLDDAPDFTACSSPKDYQDLAQGDHTLLVRAVDQAGNRDQSPAGHSWTVDTQAPETTIDEGPADPTNSTSASFSFSSDDPGAGFECKLDDAPDFTACSSPKDYQDLPAGDHTLEVRAVDAIGNRDQTPAGHSWTIDTEAPETTIDEGPADPTSSTSASFSFSSDEPGASFECKLDDAADFSACSSPKDYQDLAVEDHTLAVRAVDQAGNRDSSPAGHSWTIEAGDPVIAAVGDLACSSSTPLPDACRQMATSELVVGMDPLDAFLAVGDQQEECGELANYQSIYDPSWGRVKDKTYPIPGNHEYQLADCLPGKLNGAPDYFEYFGDAATPLQPGCRVSCKGYYSFDLGDWHIVALNSNCNKAGGCGAGSPQETWLRNDLAATTKSCILAYAHHPRYASKGGASTSMQPLWAALYDGGTDVVLSGHAHVYERYDRLGRGAPDSPEPTVDANGMRQIIVGTGGASHHVFTTIRTGSQVRNNDTFGVARFELHSGSYEWEFLPEAGKTFTDSGSDTCQGAPRPADTEAPSTPEGLTATAASPSRVDLSWTAATDNVAVASYGVYRDGALIGTTSSTTYADQTAQPSTTHEYAVDAVDPHGNRSPQSAPATATTPGTPSIFRAASFGSNARAFTVTVDAPAGIVAGDVMLASIDVRTVPAITPPPGWTLLRMDSHLNTMTKATYYRVVGAGEPASYTWTFDTKKAAAGAIVAYGGIDPLAPIDVSGGLVNAQSKTIKAPSITTTRPFARLVGFFGTAAQTTIAPPVAMTERGEVASTAAGDNVTLEVGGAPTLAAGPTGQHRATADAAAPNIGHLVALTPAG